MASAVEFILSLKDKLTGPSRAAKASLDSVKTSLKSVDTASRQVARASGLGSQQLYRYGAASKGVGIAADMLGRVLGAKTAVGFVRAHAGASAFAGRLPSMGSLVESLGSGAAALGPMLLGIGAALLSVGAGGAGLVAAGAKYASEMAGFKENTLFAYKYILGGSDKASMMFKEADDLARAIGGHTTKTGESMRELMGGGFSQTQSKDITAAIADVGALSPTANTDAISAQLAQMKGAGRVLAEDLKPLLNAGLNDDIFYQVLREMTGKTDQKDLKKLLETGKVDADTGIQAILETVNRMGGNKGLGSIAAARANETMGGQIDAAKGMFERLFMSISSGPAGSAMGALAKQVTAFLDPKEAGGQRILAVMNAMASAVGGLLASLQGGALNSFLTGLLGYFEALRPIASAFFSSFGTGVMAAVTAVRQIMTAMGGASSTSLDMVGIAKALGSAFAWVAVAIGAVIGVIAAVAGVIGLVVVGIGTGLVDFVGWLAETAAKLVAFSDAAPGIAGQFIAGLVLGIKDGIVDVVGAMGEMGQAAISAVTDVFKIKSPSRVMMEVGGYVSEGFAQGVDGGAPQASAAVANMVAPSAVRSFGGAGGGSASMGNITINITGVEGGADAAEEMAARVSDALRTILAGWASEAGAAPAAVLCRRTGTRTPRTGTPVSLATSCCLDAQRSRSNGAASSTRRAPRARTAPRSPTVAAKVPASTSSSPWSAPTRGRSGAGCSPSSTRPRRHRRRGASVTRRRKPSK